MRMLLLLLLRLPLLLPLVRLRRLRLPGHAAGRITTRMLQQHQHMGSQRELAPIWQQQGRLNPLLHYEVLPRPAAVRGSLLVAPPLAACAAAARTAAALLAAAAARLAAATALLHAALLAAALLAGIWLASALLATAQRAQPVQQAGQGGEWIHRLPLHAVPVL